MNTIIESSRRRRRCRTGGVAAIGRSAHGSRRRQTVGAVARRVDRWARAALDGAGGLHLHVGL